MSFHHLLHQGDSRDLSFIPSESVHLVVTSPPYWNLKEYNGDHAAQLGDIEDYEAFLIELNKVWAECLRILIPGGRVVCVVGDVVVSRKEYGRHLLFPLHSDIQVACRRMGFDNLNPIIWHKIANAKYEVDRGGGGGFLGKPFEPNGIVKNDMEYILMLRKGGAYRQPTLEQRELSRIPKDQYGQWFQQIWNLPGASLKNHPAPYPLELATRLVLMFSFYGDTVVDPFSGSGTTMLAAIENNRNSIGVELNPDYCKMAYDRLKGLSLLGDHVLKVEADWAKEKLASL
jgi:modification methylase